MNDSKNQIFNEEGTADISGTEADPEADDDVSEANKKSGLYTDSDESHPQEVNIGGEVDKNEKLHLKTD